MNVEPSLVAEGEWFRQRLSAWSKRRPEAPCSEWYVARSPGRLDVMGGIADYSGSLVLEMPIAEATWVAVRRTAGTCILLHSEASDSSCHTAELPAGEVARHVADPVALGQLVRAEPGRAWAAYVLGCLWPLAQRGELSLGGLHIFIASQVPQSLGVSSSAALEVASLSALSRCFAVAMAPAELALACQAVENRVVGAACGVMDQLTCCLGEDGRLLPILCQPAAQGASLPIPSGLQLWGIDSGVRHQVSGVGYTSVRTAAFMGLRMLARELGYEVLPGEPGRVELRGEGRGYLANVDPDRYRKELRPLLPAAVAGGEFLRQYQGISDPVTRVDPALTYPVRAATSHPVFEHQRVQRFVQLVSSSSDAIRGVDKKNELGELMLQAHASYSACGLGSSGTDRLVELVMEEGPEQGLYGAKITGGGSGGTVAVLGDGGAHAEAAVRRVVERYQRESGHAPHVFRGSSPGAATFGVSSLASPPETGQLGASGVSG